MHNVELEGQSTIEPERNRNEAVGMWSSLFKFTTSKHAIVLGPALCLSVSARVVVPSMAIFFGKIFGSFSNFGAGIIDGDELMHIVSIDAIALVGLGGATWLLKGGFFALWLVFGELQAKAVRDHLFQSLLEKDLEWFEKRESGVGSLLSRLQAQIRDLQIGTSQPLGFAISYVVQGLASVGLAFYYCWKPTLGILAGMPASAIVLAFISASMRPSIVAQDRALSKASKLSNHAFKAIDTVNCFNNQEHEVRQFTTVIQEAAKFYLKQALANSAQIGFMRFITTAIFVQGFWYGGHLAASGATTPAKVLTTFWACLMATKAYEDITPQLIVLEKGRASAAALKAILDHVGKGKKNSRALDGAAPTFCDGDIEIRNMTFAYPSRPLQVVLKASTFFFPAGETTFIVGKSGSGKSTVGDIIMRFYKPNTGFVFIDGTPIEELDINWLRNNVTLVQQQSILFNETISKNIAFGKRDHASVSQEDVKVCIDVAMLQTTIKDLPKGIDTMVGSSGCALSGGQKQRIAIARARLRDTPVLILDESTSALDHTTRAAVLEAIRDWRRGKTTIVITHDMSQITDEDFVYVLKDGHIAEEGYRHSLVNSRDGFFSPRLTTPQVATAAHYDFGLAARSTSFRCSGNKYRSMASNGSKSSIGRRDSLELQLRFISEDTIYHDSSLSSPDDSRDKIVKRRISDRTRAILDEARKSTIMNAAPLFSQQPKPLRELEQLQAPNARTRAFRPMSMHQSITTQSIYRQSSTRHKSVVDLSLSNRVSAINIGLGPRQPVVPSSPTMSVWKVLSTVWPTLDGRARHFVILGIISTVIHAAAPSCFSYIFAQLLGTFYMRNSRAQKALEYSMAILGIAVTDGAAGFSMHYLLEASSQAWIDKLRIEAMTRILDQPRAWFDHDQNSVPRLMSCLDRNAEEMRNLVGRFAGFIVAIVEMMSISISWSFTQCWKVTVVAMASAPVLYLITKSFESVSSKWEDLTNDAGDVAEAIFVETFTDIRTVRSLTLESYFHKKYTRATSGAFQVGVKRGLVSGFFFGASDSAINFVTALIFWYGARLAHSYQFPVKSILTVFSMLLFSTANANAVLAWMPQISSSVDTAGRLLRLAKLPLHTSHKHSGTLRLNPQEQTTLSGPIMFENLTFYYPSRPEAPVLRNLDLCIPGGACTAIVGASGSGKSTIASLILGLYPPSGDLDGRATSDASSGVASLTLSGRDIRSYYLPSLRSMISIVPQTPILFPTSIRTNITYGLDLISSLTTTANVELAAQRAGIHDFIVTLPQKYETAIGDGGIGVSGGQAQRIVIARALIRKPRILILDEATSALDDENAEIVRQSVLGLVEEARMGLSVVGKGGGMTVIIITHSQEMMECAEHVVVMDGGRVVREYNPRLD